MVTASEAQPYRRACRVRLAASAGVFVAVLLLAVAIFLVNVNRLPPYVPPPMVLPVPNAFDDYMAAGMLIHDSPVISPKSEAVPTTPALRKAVVANRAALARLREGFRHRYFTPARYGYDTPMPEFANFRLLAGALIAEGLLAERDGRRGDAARSYVDCLRLATDIPRGGALQHYYLGYSIWKKGAAPLQRITDFLDTVSARRAAREMERLQNTAPTAADALLGEGDWEVGTWTDMVRRFRSPADYTAFIETATDGYDITGGWQFYLSPKEESFRCCRAYVEALASCARQPYCAHPAPPPRPAGILAQFMVRAIDEVPISNYQQPALARMISVQLAARAYTLEHGAPPANAQALVPQYLNRVPDDPFAPRPLTLHVKNGKVLVYSVGPDGTDDGGTSIKGYVSQGSKGDLLTVEAQK